MANNDVATGDLNYADRLWKTADALRGQVDAAEYKHVVLGMLFLKYISDSFESRRDDLRAELTQDGIKGEQLERLLESRDEYTAERVFWVPQEARWPNLQNQAARPEIASLIDDAILAVERDNPNLKSKLPRDYARRGIDPVKMKSLIDLVSDIGFKGGRDKARDMLGRVYEYFLGKFAAAEGKLGGEFYTPRSVVRVLVEMLEPYQGRIYDPACGSGGMFVQSEKFVEAHGGRRTDVSIFGQESNPTTWRLAHMNLSRVLAENIVEEFAIGLLVASGSKARQGADLSEAGLSITGGIIKSLAREVLDRLNSQLPHDEREHVLGVLTRPPHPTLVENNRWFHGLLTDGVPVEYKDIQTGETRGSLARLIDFENPAKNDFLVVRQLTVTGANGKTIRPDLVLYVNGLPLVVIELKYPANTAADLDVAIDQLGRYQTVAPDLFAPNLLLVASDGLLTRVGSVTSGRQRFMQWRPASGGEPTLEALIRELLNPDAILDYLRSCVAFEEDERGNIVKKVAGYHQFRAVCKARASVIGAIKTPDREGDEAAGKGGVVWHTQGSGKSLTMLMLAGTLVRAADMANPTLVIVTDRNDLDDQLFDTFAMGQALLRQDPVQADSREQLGHLLNRSSGGVVFTTIHKFTEAHAKISERANVVVMADEAHRSQYGFVDGGARWMREALPNATFVGFTGTPLTAGDKVTRHVFGDYADVYDIRQSVADGATVPIYYEPQIVKLTIDEAGADAAEARIAEKLAEYATRDENGIETPENVRIPLEELYGAPERLERLAKFVVEHWEWRRAAIEGKAMIVTMSRDIAARLYDEIRKLRPGWYEEDDSKGAMKVIMTGGPDDPAHMARHVRGKAGRKALADRFKNPADDFRLAIVVDMWLTGFDVPSAHTMYLDKPLAGHNLMQAIARVNRVYGDKPGGLIVDLIGLADPLADALATYANATGQTDKPVKELQDEAIPAMRSAFEQLRAFFHGYDYAEAMEAEQAKVLRVYLGAIDHVLDLKNNVGKETGWQRFREMVKRLATAFALAAPREETRDVAPHLAFFQRMAAMIRKRLADEVGPSRGGAGVDSGSRDIDAAVRQVIGGAVNAGEVIDLFAAAGLEAGRLDILSDEFLERVSALEQKNLALEMLRKLLNDQIKISERSNIVQARKFREALEKAMLGYTNKQISTAQMIAQLLELAKWVRDAKRHGEELGLSKEETAFYDALAENGSAKDVMKSDQLRLMARGLAEMIKKMPKLDWTQRESVRADLRRKVRRLLAMYGYPPDLSEDATQLVLKQAELSTEYAE